jgi:hypothetical protein
VNVIIDISGKIIVDDVSDVGNVETTSCDSSGDENWATAVPNHYISCHTKKQAFRMGESLPEHLKGTFTLALSAVTVNGCGREVLVDQEVRQ